MANAMTKFCNSSHRGVLIVICQHGGIHISNQFSVAWKVRKTLPKINRLMLCGQGGHHRKNGGSNFW